jgi:hypothetical protein
MKRLAIVQSNYIPWRGYFDLIASVDSFILYDDAQYTRRDWRNRNRIKTAQGSQWLTIPVLVRGKYTQPINQTQISQANWAGQHWKQISQHYRAAPYFDHYAPAFAQLYAEAALMPMLSAVNQHFLLAICQMLGIATPISNSADYGQLGAGKTEKLIGLCQAAGATAYLSGPSARSYLNEDAFTAAGIALHYANYAGYAEYPQRYPPYDPHVSIIDLLFNTGPAAASYLKMADGSLWS